MPQRRHHRPYTKPPASKAQYLSQLSQPMRRALVRCHTLVVLTDRAKGGAVASIAHGTIDSLSKHGLIEQARDNRARAVWRPTQRGLAILTADEPCFLTPAASPHGTEHGYTTVAAHGLPGEPEGVPRAQTASWSSEAIQNRDIRQTQTWTLELGNLERTIERWRTLTDRPELLREVELIQRRADSLRRKLAAA